jgi:AraC-like DNA-binding protein
MPGPATHTTEILSGGIFHSYHSAFRKEHVAFLAHNNLVFLASGEFLMETATEKVSLEKGGMLLIRKNQLGQITKMPLPGEDYETIVISLREEILRKMALEAEYEPGPKYAGPSNVPIPANEFLQGFFRSVLPYARAKSASMPAGMGELKIAEAVKLLLHAVPGLRDLLFDFSEPHKIDLEKFMRSNFHFNVPVEKFAQLTGRSLAGFKRDFSRIFGTSPRHWLQERRLTEARHLIEEKNRKPSAIYLDLGFESLSHFSSSFKKMFGKAPSEM